MSNAAKFFPHSRAIRGGAIDPWGTIRLLNKRVKEPPEDSRDYTYFKDNLELQPGLKIWSNKLVPYAKLGGYRAVVCKDVVDVVAEDGTVVEEVSALEFVVVEIHESLVYPNGYLGTSKKREEKQGNMRWRWIKSLDQASRGEKPLACDNSPFVKVDEKYAGQELLRLDFGSRDEAEAVVFTRDGDLVPSKLHYPLSFAKWAPESPAAQFSVPDRTQH